MRLFSITLTAAVAAAFFFGSAVSAEAKSQPKPKYKTITIKSGDTLTAIAKRFKTSVQRLYDANGKIADPDLILAGDKLRVPSAKLKIAKRPMPSNTPTQPVVSYNYR